MKTPFESPEAAVEIPSEKVLYHLVQPSETAYGISKKYDIEVAQLIDWNQLDENASISIGQKLKVSGTFIEQKIIKKEKVPEDKEKADATKIEEEVANYHEVKPGETFYSLSKKYNISVKDLIRINNKSDASIQIGEKLKIKE